MTSTSPKENRWFLACGSFLTGAISAALGAWLLHSAEPSVFELTSAGEARPDPIVATVADRPITASSVRREMQKRGGHDASRFATLESRREVLDDLVHAEVLALAAERHGFSADPTIASRYKQMLADRFWREQIGGLQAEARVSDEEIQARFAATREKLRLPDRVRASAILLRTSPYATSEDKASTRKRAEAIAKQASSKAGQPGAFAQLVQAHSEDPKSRARGGDIGWLVRGGSQAVWDEHVVEAAHQIAQIGTVGPVVETRLGFVVLTLTGREPGSDVELEAVRKQLQNEIYAEKMRAAQDRHYAQLRESFEVKVDDTALSAIGLELATAQHGEGPPTFPLSGESE